MIAFAETDLPEPDSPTIATVSPRFTVRLTPRTALTTPAVVSKEMSRFRTRKISSFSPCHFLLHILHLRIQCITQTIRQHVKAQHQKSHDN